MDPPQQGHYLRFLEEIHAALMPRTYAEIGVQFGASLRLALPGTTCVGIDPGLSIRYRIEPKTGLFKLTSDDFFAQHDLSEVLGGRPLDLAFIDGQHLFEYALRDFINLERYCDPDSIILIHDCYPLDAESSSRERTTKIWSGDVWKLILCLKELRPDLRVDTVNVSPTGLGIVRQLDPASTVLSDRYGEACSRYVGLDFAAIAKNKQELLNLVPEGQIFASSLQPPFRDGSPSVLRLRRAIRLPRAATLMGLSRRYASRFKAAMVRWMPSKAKA